MASTNEAPVPGAVIDRARPTRVRFLVLALLAVATMTNYLDRTILGIAAPAMSKDLGLSAAVMGVVFSAFSWTYAAFQIPGGIFLDRFGSRLTYFLAFTCWSGCTALLGFVSGLKSLLAMRFGLGICEAPCFPTNSRVVAAWFPQTERGVATSVYTVGEYLGLAAFSPLLFWILERYGWRTLFISVGLSSIFFAGVWWVV
jgi:ACS family D-galactonate transporter-like MFS transporter